MERFATFGDAQERLAQLEGGLPFDFSRDNPRTLEIAARHGIRDEVAEAIESSRELDPVIDATVARLDRAATRAHPAGPAPLPGFVASEIWEGFAPTPYLVKRLLGPREVTVLFGESGHFKSVVAVDLACSVGLGEPFLGLRTARRAGVLYVAGEGHNGIRKRVRAWHLKRGNDSTSPQPALYITTSGGDLIGNPDQLRATALHAATVLGVPIELVIIDTLAANFGNGDEYHARDMQLAISGAGLAAPDAAVLLVHHVGHSDKDRERGSYALMAAADCRVKAEYDSISKVLDLIWLKVKDDERPEPLQLTWEAIPLDWEDADGEQLTSVVLERLEGERPHGGGPRVSKLGANQEAALKVLRTLLAKQRRNVAERGDDPLSACVLTTGWAAAVKERIGYKRVPEVQRALIERGLIVIEGPHVRPVEITP